MVVDNMLLPVALCDDVYNDAAGGALFYCNLLQSNWIYDLDLPHIFI